MIFKNLSVISFSEKRIYNYYEFNNIGLNIILGERGTDKDETNGVGKTALIESLRYCISSNLPDAFKKKAELIHHDLCVVLEVLCEEKAIRIRRSFSDDSIIYVTNDIDSDPYSIIGWDPIPKQNYAEYVQRIMYADMDFGIEEQPPTFASVREFLMRDEKSGYGNNIYLANRSALSMSKILAFLSLLPYDLEGKLALQKKVIKSLENEKKIILDIGKDIKDIRNSRDKAIAEIRKLKTMLAEASISHKIEYDESKYYELKSRIDHIQQRIHQLEFARRQHLQNIQDLEDNLKKAKEFINLKPFYEQIVKYFPDQLSKNYDEMLSFYQYMLDNRGGYFKKQIDKIEKQLKPLYSQQDSCLEELSEVTKLVKNSELVIDLQQISNEITEKYKRIAEFEYKIELYSKKGSIENSIRKEKANLEKLVEQYKQFFSESSNRVEIIQKHFQDLVEITYKGDAIGNLDYIFEDSVQGRVNTGRIKIDCSLTDEQSYGRSNMKIILFDLALLLNRIDHNSGLLFLFHDGPFGQITGPTIKYAMLMHIDRYLKKAGGGQYFVTLNVEELNGIVDSDGSNEADTILKSFEKAKTIIARLQRTSDDTSRFMGIKY